MLYITKAQAKKIKGKQICDGSICNPVAFKNGFIISEEVIDILNILDKKELIEISKEEISKENKTNILSL